MMRGATYSHSILLLYINLRKDVKHTQTILKLQLHIFSLRESSDPLTSFNQNKYHIKIRLSKTENVLCTSYHVYIFIYQKNSFLFQLFFLITFLFIFCIFYHFSFSSLFTIALFFFFFRNRALYSFSTGKYKRFERYLQSI